MDANSKTLADLLTPEELAKYKLTEYPFNLQIIGDALRVKLQEDPEYEVWVPAVYYRHSKIAKQGTPLGINLPGIFVSNHGEVCRNLGGKVKKFKSWPAKEDGYMNVSLASNTTVVLHRLMGCSFLPIPESLADTHPKDLQVNHIDGNKLNFALGNIEWATFSSNIEHAYENELRTALPKGIEHFRTKPVKGAVLRGKLKGYEFVLLGDEAKISAGFTPHLIVAACKGRIQEHRHCSWSHIPKDDIQHYPVGVTEELVAELNSLTANGTHWVEATDVETGEIKTLPGTVAGLKEAGFDYKSVNRVILGERKTYKGHTFKKIEK